MNPLQSLWSYILGHVVVILGVALALTVGYASWIHFVTVPMLEKDVKVAQANERAADQRTETAATANRAMAGAVDRCNASIETVRAQGQQTQQALSPILQRLGVIGKDVQKQLGAYKPDPKKSDCENAKAELQLFRQERGR